jgi:SlyX protein
MTHQQREIDRLKKRLEASDDRIAELESGLPAPGNEKPPHY